MGLHSYSWPPRVGNERHEQVGGGGVAARERDQSRATSPRLAFNDFLHALTLALTLLLVASSWSRRLLSAHLARSGHVARSGEAREVWIVPGGKVSVALYRQECG